MKKKLSMLLLIMMVVMFAPLDLFADEWNTTITANGEEANPSGSLYSWNLYMLSEGSYGTISEFLAYMNITRIYQQIPKIYLERTETADMVNRLAADNIEIVLLLGDRAWGLAESDLSYAKDYIDKLAAYNAGIGSANPITKIALDVETHTYSEWSNDKVGYFTAYIEKMKELYDYAHLKGLSVVQVIPVYYDKIDAELFREFVSTCADELSLMNYNRNIQVSGIKDEVELCKELGMKIETIFETMPCSDSYGVTSDITYFYDGFEALKDKRDLILSTYNYENLTVSYHHFSTIYYVVTGNYFADIYAYTNPEDPTRNNLGQTYALDSIILTGDDGSVVEAGLYNPNRGYEYEESCYFVMGIKPGVEYTISSPDPQYKISTPTKTFTFEEGELVDYTSIRIQYVETPVTSPTHVEEIRDAKEATCSEAGYTGDKYCSGCNTLIEKGEVIEKLAHVEEIRNAKEATYSEAGYTGDKYCSECDTLLEKGEVIAQLTHEDEVRNVKEATCSEEGYTGDKYCSICNTLVEKGEVIEKLAHVEEIRNVKKATCSEAGYTGDKYCSVCNTLLEKGEVIEMLSHVEEIRNAKEATCSEEGYTGDRYCSKCDILLAKGEVIEKLAHTASEWTYGGSGNHIKTCTICNKTIVIELCTDNDSNSACDTCKYEMPRTLTFTKSNTLSSGNKYMIVSGNHSLNYDLSRTSVYFNSNAGSYIPQQTVLEGQIWVYDKGVLYSEVNGEKYYLAVKSSADIYITTDASKAAEWTGSSNRLTTKVSTSSWLFWNRTKTYYLYSNNGQFDLTTSRKTISFYKVNG